MTLVFPAPNPGDIVWCRFPQVEHIHPGPKSRPALVLSVMDDSHPVRVRVVYGTSQKPTPIRRGELLIRRENEAAFRLSGLSYPTKFSFSKVVVLPYTSVWFGPALLASGLFAPTPRLGMLHAALMGKLQRAAREAGLIVLG